MPLARQLQRHFPALVFLLGLGAILSRAWVAEDGYITFRAVENLYQGYGLVYNPGEKIEVFTHPLWMLVLVLIRGIGLPLHFGSILAGFCFCAVALVLLIFRRGPDGGRVFPFAALVLSSISGFRDFATAGMEFSLVFLLLTLLYTRLERGIARQPAAVASLLALLYLTRPELALLVPYYSLFFLYELWRGDDRGALAGRRGIRSLISWKLVGRLFAWGLPLLLLCGSYHLFRFWYYNDLFPNTYYAKAGLSSNYFQGLAYLFYTILWAPGLWLVLAVLGGFPLLQKTRVLLEPRAYPALLRDAGAALLLIFYVVRVGGDFMSFRFLLPEVTILALVADRFFRRFRAARIGAYLLQWARARDRAKTLQAEDFAFTVRAGSLALFLLLLAYPVPYSRGYVADERQVFTQGFENNPVSLWFSQDYPWGKTGAEFRRLQQCLGYPRFWITNSQAQARCMSGVGLGYFGMAAGPGVKILDEQGLPNREIATAPVLFRWRPGHEHYVAFGQVLEKRVLFCSTGEPAYDRAMRTPAGVLVHFDPELLVTVPDIEARLARLSELKERGSAAIPRLERAYGLSLAELRQRVADTVDDPANRRRRACWNEFDQDLAVYFY